MISATSESMIPHTMQKKSHVKKHNLSIDRLSQQSYSTSRLGNFARIIGFVWVPNFWLGPSLGPGLGPAWARAWAWAWAHLGPGLGPGEPISEGEHATVDVTPIEDQEAE